MFLVILTLFSLAGISFTSSLHKRGGGHNVPLINCPSCQHHICDISNTIQCEVCQIIIPHQGQPPQDVKCAQIGHCHEDHHHFCCNTEACVASLFGEFHVTNTIPQHIDYTDSMAHCPVCHEGYCDFVYRDTCHRCKIDLHLGHPGQLPHVHCLKPNEHCNENHNTLCCNDESCIARAFGQHYPGTPSTYPTTASSSRNTSTTNHIINQQTMYVSCPVCSQGICDPSRSHPFCTGCVYHQDQKTTTCIKQGHEHECTDTGHHICCLTDECITKWFGVVVKTIDQGSSLLYTSIFCPSCDPHGQCHYSLCDKCDYHIKHISLPPELKCIQQGHHCHNEDAHHFCCRDIKCIEQAFGSNYWMITTTLPPSHQVTTQPTTVTSTPAVQTTRKLDLVECPLCRNGHCDFQNNTKCVVCRISFDSKNASIMPITHCEITDNCIDGANVLCCRTEQCIIGAYEPYFKTFRSSTTLPTTAGIPGHTEVNSSNPITFKHTSVVTQPSISNGSTPTLPSLTTTTSTISPSASPFFPSSIGANTTEATTPLTPNGTTGFVSSATIVSSSTDIPSNCSDSITNCATLKGYGVCHAIPEQRDMYDIAFLRCRQTCNLCTEVYKPLVDTTTTPRPSIHCQVCGDYNKDIPCDTRSIYIGPTVSCSGNNNYCMTDIVHSHSNVRVFKRCVNETVCRNQWLSQTSDQDHCTNYGHVPVSGDYTCHFCCTSNKCNQGLLPDSSTLYSKS